MDTSRGGELSQKALTKTNRHQSQTLIDYALLLSMTHLHAIVSFLFVCAFAISMRAFRIPLIFAPRVSDHRVATELAAVHKTANNIHIHTHAHAHSHVERYRLMLSHRCADRSAGILAHKTPTMIYMFRAPWRVGVCVYVCIGVALVINIRTLGTLFRTIQPFCVAPATGAMLPVRLHCGVCVRVYSSEFTHAHTHTHMFAGRD